MSNKNVPIGDNLVLFVWTSDIPELASQVDRRFKHNVIHFTCRFNAKLTLLYHDICLLECINKIIVLELYVSYIISYNELRKMILLARKSLEISQMFYLSPRSGAQTN